MTTAIIFDHRGRTEKGRPGPLEVRVTIERKAYYVNTGIKVLKSEWKYGEIVNRPDSDELMERLRTIEQAVAVEINKCLEARVPVDVAEIRRAVWGCRTDETIIQQTPFLDWFAEVYPTLPLAEGTRRRYKCVHARLRACTLFNNWTDCTVENVMRFDAWLRNLKREQSDAEQKMGAKAAPLEEGTIYNHHRVLRAMMSRAVAMGKLNENPYTRLKGKFKRGDKDVVSYLTEEEVAAFTSLQPVPGTMMAVARDLFVFQLYTGLSYSDMQNFSIDDYKKVDGRWINTGVRIKTGVPYISQLLSPAVEILEKYGMKIPKLGNADYNHCLKALGMAAGISTPLHSHIARHTFATWMLKNGVRIENVSRMLGHTNITQTQRYAKVLAESVHEDFLKVEELIQKKGD